MDELTVDQTLRGSVILHGRCGRGGGDSAMTVDTQIHGVEKEVCDREPTPQCHRWVN